MGEYSPRKEIINKIKNFKNPYQIYDFLNENVPNELLIDEEFIKELIEANPLVVEALNIKKGIEIGENIKDEIKEKGLEIVVEDDEKLMLIPREYREELYELALKYESEEEFGKAKRIYRRIVEFGIGQVDKFYKRHNKNEEAKETIYYKSKFSYYKCKVQNGEPLTEEDLRELENLAKEDKENILGFTKQGKITRFQFFESMFEDITIEELEEEILPSITNWSGGGEGSGPRPPHPPKGEEYEEELLPERRLEHLKKDFKIESCKIGKGKFTGFVIFKIKDSDVVIVEKFFELKGKGKNRNVVPSYGTATYYIHKEAELDAKIDLEKSDRTKLVEMKRKQKDSSLKLIDSNYHRGEDYYERQKRKFKAIEENGRKLRNSKSATYTVGMEQDIEETSRGEINVKGEVVEVYTEIADVSDEATKVDAEIADVSDEATKVDAEIVDVGDETIEADTEIAGVSDVIIKEDEEIEEIIEEQGSQIDSSTVSIDYNIEELIELISEFDKEFEEFQTKLLDIQNQIEGLNSKINQIQEDIDNKLKETIVNEEIKDIILQGISIIEECKAKRKELEALKERIIIEEKKNREEREKIRKQLNAKIKGEQ